MAHSFDLLALASESPIIFYETVFAPCCFLSLLSAGRTLKIQNPLFFTLFFVFQSQVTVLLTIRFFKQLCGSLGFIEVH